MPNSKFAELVARRRQQLGRKGLRRRGGVWLFPYAVEREYRNRLLGRLDLLQGSVERLLIERLPYFLEEADAKLRADYFLDDIKTVMAAIAASAHEVFGNAEELGSAVAVQVAAFNREQFKRIVRTVLGVNPLVNDAFLDAQLKLFAQENAALISSIPDQYLKDVEGVVYRGMRGGATLKQLQDDIQGRFKVTRNRAQFIARDQVAKLNGQLSEIRQKRIGITEYIWSSAHDERVRYSHRVMDGKICRWDDPTVYRNPGEEDWKSRAAIGGFIGNPGQDYQCRCYSDPVMEDLIGVFNDSKG